jgi:hypothetical protein
MTDIPFPNGFLTAFLGLLCQRSVSLTPLLSITQDRPVLSSDIFRVSLPCLADLKQIVAPSHDGMT